MFLMEEAFAQLPVNAKEDGDTADVQKTNGDGHQESGQDQPATISTGPVPQGLTNKVDLEPLAIIGMAFQLPDGATDEDTFWDMLVEKRCASREYPKERLNIDAFHSADNNKPCTIKSKNAHFLEDDIHDFDSTFFHVSPADAKAMDPCQRTLLETTYHALESSGLSLNAISGSKTSVHVGCFSSDHMISAFRDSERIQKYSATGISSAMLSNRLSWFFNLHGPSITLDTACSSGMVALDLACQGLWSGQTDMGIVASSNLILSAELNISLSNMGFLSPDGRCFSFDHRANGYARGEGVAALIIKPLSKAIESGNQIRALIRSIGSNQDGRTNGGITQPSRAMQAELIRGTYRRAGTGLDMSKTRFFEAHGTGTAIGDPTEARAIGECFREHRSDKEPLYVGAVKSNIGHTEGTSGLAGIIKTVLALEKGVIPPNTNFERLNPDIDDEFYRLAFPQECIAWPSVPGEVRRASVNSFGFGGANAHVVLDDARSYLQAHRMNGKHRTSPPKTADTVPHARDFTMTIEDSSSATAPQLLVFSASDQGGIERQIRAHSAYIKGFRDCYPPNFFSDYAFTLAAYRTKHTWNSFCVLETQQDARNLEKLLKHGPAKAGSLSSSLKLGLVFTGQGAQWHGMGRELLSNVVFAESINRSQQYLTSLGCKWFIVSRLIDDNYSQSISEPQYSQVLTTVVQLALVDLSSHFGITPAVAVGHSSGEIAAAYAAGLLSQSSAIKISYHRGLLCSQLEASCGVRWGMAAIGLPKEEVERKLHILWHEKCPIVVSCINSPSNVTVSGPEVEVQLLISHMLSKEVFCRRLRVSLGYHSPQLSQIGSRYLELLGALDPRLPNGRQRPVMVSSVTGELVSHDTVCNGEYWVQNMVSVVNFLGAIERCSQTSRKTQVMRSLGSNRTNELCVEGWLEIGPHSALQGPIREILTPLSGVKDVRYTSALVRGKSAASTLLTAAGYLHSHNFHVNLVEVTALGLNKKEVESRTMSNVPFYQFNHDVRYWEESPASVNFRFRSHGSHELLGTRIGDPNPFEAEWRLFIQEDTMPWIRDHKINNIMLYPAAGMLVMAIEAARQLTPQISLEAIQLEDVSIPAPIVIPTTGEQIEVRLHVSSYEKSEIQDFRIFLCKPENAHEIVCHGKIRRIFKRAPSEIDNGRETRESAARLASEYDDILLSCERRMNEENLYRTFDEKLGLEYGPSFQTLRRVRFDNAGHAIAHLTRYEAGICSSHIIHPTRLDGMFQLCFPAARSMDELKTMVPTHIARLWVSTSNSNQHLSDETEEAIYATTTSNLRNNATFNIKAFEEMTKRVKVEVEDLQLTAVSTKSEKTKALEQASYLCAHMEWRVDLDTLSREEMQIFCDEARPTKPVPKQRFRDITRLCLHFGAQALREVPEERIVDSMKKYAIWFRRHLHRLPTDPTMTSDAVEHLCVSLLPSTRVELQITIGKQLPNILRGEIDPLQLFFTDEGRMTRFYAETMEDSTSQMPFSRFLDSLTHKKPNMSFLEVGAGTGGSTTEIMKTIGNNTTGVAFERYTYTDISPSFFEQAQERFTSLHNRLTYQTLDIERDPVSQGYEAGTYDVVIADNVLHATKDLCRTLQHVHKLLKPGGKLILRELTAPEEVQTGYIFGLLPGWWLATEETRQLSPVMNVSSWDQLMRDNGFSGTDIILPDYPGGECSQLTFMISTALDRAVRVPGVQIPVAISPKFIVDPWSDRQSALATGIALSLGNSRQHVNMMDLTSAASLATSEEFAHDFIMLNETETPILHAMEDLIFTSMKAVLASARSILWVKHSGGGNHASKPEYATSDGLCRVSRNENTRVLLVTLALETSGPLNAPRIGRVFQEMHNNISAATSTIEPEYSMIQGRLHINRVRRARYLDEHIFKRIAGPVLCERAAGQRLRIGIRVPGLLDTIEYTQDQMKSSVLPAEEIEIEVKAIGINYKDLIALLGQGKSDSLGCEYSGVVRATGLAVVDIKPGDRVAAIINENWIQTYCRAHVKNVIRVPDDISFATAAAIPVAYCTAYYSLLDIAHLRHGETVLIHSAAGGTGQAMVQLAQWIGATVFATVGDLSKKTILMNVYGIPESHIFSSRDASFAAGIKRMTNLGVDVVVNSLSGTLMEASFDCIAPFGRFVEIGLKDAYLRKSLPMHTFTKNVSFSSVDMELIFSRKDRRCEHLLRQVFNMFTQGTLRVAAPRLYSLGEIESAFRYLQSGKSSGKMVVEVGTEDVLPIVQGQSSSYILPGDATYVVAGGLGSIGRHIASWLVSRGAKNLILLSRSGPKDDDIHLLDMLEDMRRAGVNVVFPICDITDRSALDGVITSLSKTMPPIRGCIQAAMVLHDATLATMSIEEWRTAIRPKVDGSWNLHIALPSGMDFFVLLSSVAGIFGNGGQANYASGNTYVDALAGYRASQGERAVSLDIGYVLEDGFEAKSKASLDRVNAFLKLRPSSLDEIIAMLDYYCQPGLLPTPTQSQVITGLELPADIRSKGFEVPQVLHSPLFRHMFQVESSNALVQLPAARQQKTVTSAFLDASSTGEGTRIIAEALREKLSRVLGVAHEHIDLNQSLVSYGVDSLVGLELRNWIGKEVKADLTVFEILSGTTLNEIGKIATAKSLLSVKDI